MSEQRLMTLHFKCPEDFQFREADALVRSISHLYNKLENLAEGEYRVRGRDESLVLDSSEPKNRLVLRELKYGSDFIIVVVISAASLAAAIVSMIASVKDMRDRDREAARRTSERDFRRLLREHRDEDLRKAVAAYAAEHRIDIGQLLDQVSPELEIQYSMSADYVPEDSPYR